MATGTETESGSSGSINFSDSVDRLRPPKSQPRANEIGRKHKKRRRRDRIKSDGAWWWWKSQLSAGGLAHPNRLESPRHPSWWKTLDEIQSELNLFSLSFHLFTYSIAGIFSPVFWGKNTSLLFKKIPFIDANDFESITLTDRFKSRPELLEWWMVAFGMLPHHSPYWLWSAHSRCWYLYLWESVKILVSVEIDPTIH